MSPIEDEILLETISSSLSVGTLFPTRESCKSLLIAPGVSYETGGPSKQLMTSARESIADSDLACLQWKVERKQQLDTSSLVRRTRH